jgi:hypothetical protein
MQDQVTPGTTLKIPITCNEISEYQKLDEIIINSNEE